jgi:hypothetical protein
MQQGGQKDVASAASWRCERCSCGLIDWPKEIFVFYKKINISVI